jgi:hypothetical protein
MSLPWWSKYDAQMYHALSLFPENLEGKFLNPDEFRGHFKDFYGRPVQDIVEALHHYGREGYFKAEITLMPEYLKQGQAIGRVMAALSKLQPEPSTPPNERSGLSKRVHAKVLAERSLTMAEASSLPDDAKRYLAFALSDVDRTRLREELAIYNDNSSIQPSRLVKSTRSEPTTYAARVSMEGLDRRFVRIIVTHSGEYTIAKLHAGRAPYDFMHYLFQPENSDIDITIKEVQKDVKSCGKRNGLTELVGDCGFDKMLKSTFFSTMNSDRIHFTPIADIDPQQLDAIKKQAEKVRTKK